MQGGTTSHLSAPMSNICVYTSTCRLWSALVDPDSYEFRSQPLSLLTPLRTLRGHQESLTCLQLVTGSSGGRELRSLGLGSLGALCGG
jgi:hypothetical protein